MAKRRGLLLGWIGVLAAVAVLAGCGTTNTVSKNKGASGQNASGATSSAAAGSTGSGHCGVVNPSPPNDPDHVLAGLPASLRAYYDSYGLPIRKSAYGNFKPKHGPPWTIGYSDSFSGNAWRAQALSQLRQDVAAYEKAGIVKNLIYTNSNQNNALQIQQMRSMIQQKVDIILAIPGSPTAMNGVINQAYKAGIPVLTLASPVTTPDAVNIDINEFMIGARMAQGLVQILHGKGSIVTVDGLPGTPGNQSLHAGGYAVFKNCPGIKIIGNFEGDWDNATAKTNMLKFLATHPQKIDGVWEQGSMALGVMQALKQAGRPLVTVTDGNPDKASLAIWRDNVKKGYQGVASANVPNGGMDAMFRVGIRMLQGQGLKVASIVQGGVLITGSQLNNWVKPSWTETTPGVADAPPGTWLNDNVLNLLFAHPKDTTPKTEGSCPCSTLP